MSSINSINQQVIKMQRSRAPSRRSSNNNQRARRRDGEYRPGRDNIVDDFAVMPRIPEDRFRPHIRLDAAYVNLSDPNRERPAPFEYEVAELPGEPLDNPRPVTPRGGFNGYALGMRRCIECRSWVYPPRMVDHRCPHCVDAAKEASRVNQVNQVNEEQNSINRE